MSRVVLLSLILAGLLSFHSPSAMAGENFSTSQISTGSKISKKARIRMQPVELIGYEETSSGQQAVRMAFEIPCGGRFYGLLAKPAEKLQLQVAALYQTTNVVCASLPARQEILVDFLAIQAFKTIKPMTVSEGLGRISMLTVSDVRLLSGKRDRTRVQLVSETACGTPLGLVLRPGSDGAVGVTFAERLAKGQSTKNCDRGQKVREVSVLKLGRRHFVHTIAPPNAPGVEHPRRAFYLKLAKVHPKSLKRRKGGGVRLAYRRACNEAPVGVVVGRGAKLLEKKPKIRRLL